MRALLRFALTLGLLMTLTVPATAADITYRFERTYFHCNGPTKVGNVNYQTQGVLPSWNTTAPTQSVQQGGGCGFVDNLVSTTAARNPADAVFEGDFVGNLHAFTVELHDLYVGPARQSNTVSFNVAVTVDGKTMFGGPDATPTSKPITVPLTASNSGATGIAEFTVNGLNFGTELGNGTTRRRILVKISQTGFDTSTWAFDATEAPAGITFNPRSQAAVTLTRSS